MILIFITDQMSIPSDGFPDYEPWHGFTGKNGDYFDTGFYYENDLLYTTNNKIEFYQWIKRNAHLFARNNISITIPNNFDPIKYTNIARFTVYNYVDYKSDTLFTYKVIFDGFVPKK